MPNRLRSGAARVARTFAGFTPGQKAVSVLAVVALVVGGLLFTSWAARPTYAPLYTNLSPPDASAIVDELNAAGVPHELPNATSILVPQEQVAATRVLLAGKSLPAEDTKSGWGVLDKQGLTASEFQQQVGFQRAMEGELKTTLESIQGVKSARVQLAVPKKDVFADEEGKPTASVLVTTMPGQEMSSQQVQSVVHLVAGAVPELEPEAVTVADASGKVLSTSPDSGPGAVGDLRAQQVQAYEKRLGDEVRAMLEKVVGPGNAAVKVTADLDYDQTETRSRAYDFTRGVPPSSSTTKKETLRGDGTPQGGVLGPDNIQVPNGAGRQSDYANEESTDNNPINSTDTARKSAPGGVRSLHLSALLNTNAARTVNLQQVEDMISAGVGIQEDRGDTLDVSSMPFDDSAAKAAEEALKQQQAEEQRAALMRTVRTAGLALLVLALLIVALIARRRRRKADEQRYAAELEVLQAKLEEIESRNVRALEPGTVAVAELEPAAVDPDAERMAQVREEIGDLVESQPEEVAQLLRSWLADRRA